MPGVNPQSVRGSRTGVFVGRFGNEAHDAWNAVSDDRSTGYELTGCTGSMAANRISYFFDFTGLYCDITMVLLYCNCKDFASPAAIVYPVWPRLAQ